MSERVSAGRGTPGKRRRGRGEARRRDPHPRSCHTSSASPGTTPASGSGLGGSQAAGEPPGPPSARLFSQALPSAPRTLGWLEGTPASLGSELQGARPSQENGTRAPGLARLNSGLCYQAFKPSGVFFFFLVCIFLFPVSPHPAPPASAPSRNGPGAHNACLASANKLRARKSWGSCVAPWENPSSGCWGSRL